MSKNKKLMMFAGFALVSLIAVLNFGSDKIV